MIFSERMTVARKKTGMTQSEVAERLNVSFQAVSLWERGESTPEIIRMYESWKKAEQENNRICSDQEDASVAVYSSTSRNIHINVAGKRMTLAVNDYGKECEMVNGKDEYEFYFSLEEKGTLQILKYLRNKHGYRSNLQSILEKEFGYDDGPERFCGLCEQ